MCALLRALLGCASSNSPANGDAGGDGDGDGDPGAGLDALDELDQDLMLMQLAPSAQIELCEAAQEEARALYRDEDALRGACLPQAGSVGEVVMAVFAESASEQQLDDAVAACEAELERCMTDGATLATCGPLPPPCGARIADYRECIEGVLAAPEQLTAITCDRFVRDEAARTSISMIMDEALAPCRDALAFCSDSSAWEEHAIDTVLTDTPDDEASNDEWLERIEDVAGAPRPSCDALTRDPTLDELAMTIAAQPFGSTIMIDVTTTTEWHSVVAPRVEIVLARLGAFLDGQAEICGWIRYGIAVHGEPGESRHAVLLLAE